MTLAAAARLANPKVRVADSVELHLSHNGRGVYPTGKFQPPLDLLEPPPPHTHLILPSLPDHRTQDPPPYTTLTLSLTHHEHHQPRAVLLLAHGGDSLVGDTILPLPRENL